MLTVQCKTADARRWGNYGAQAVEGLHDPRDEAASALEAASGALGGLYARLRGPAIEEHAPRHHARGRGSDE